MPMTKIEAVEMLALTSMNTNLDDSQGWFNVALKAETKGQLELAEDFLRMAVDYEMAENIERQDARDHLTTIV